MRPADLSTEHPAQRVIELRDIIVLIDGFPALAGADLVVGRGEIVRLSGRNGSGKTTLLRVCAGLMSLSGERAIVLGHDLLSVGATRTQAQRSVRANVGLLGHGEALYGDLTVSDQLAYRARLVRADATEITAATERVGLEARLGSVPVGRLSAGQRRRLSLAVMVLVRPRVWLLDEPHAGLDEAGRAMLDELLLDAAAAGATVVFAAHEPVLSRPTPLRDRPIRHVRDRPIRHVIVSGGRTVQLEGEARP